MSERHVCGPMMRMGSWEIYILIIFNSFTLFSYFFLYSYTYVSSVSYFPFKSYVYASFCLFMLPSSLLAIREFFISSTHLLRD